MQIKFPKAQREFFKCLVVFAIVSEDIKKRRRKEKATNTRISEARSNKYLAFLLLPIHLKHLSIIQNC